MLESGRLLETVTSRARTCLLSLPGTTWQRIVEYRGGVAEWRSDTMAAEVSALH
jgi:hypothetical protein